jgi:hypothetical protein
LCTKGARTFWVTAACADAIDEFDVGGTRPIETLSTPSGDVARGCAIDPATGNLAAATINTGALVTAEQGIARKKTKVTKRSRHSDARTSRCSAIQGAREAEMLFSRFVPYPFCTSVAAILLSACSLSPPLASSVEVPVPPAAPAARGMTNGDLLYVDQGYSFNDNRGHVAILTYPGFALVSEFTVAKGGYPIATTEGMCADDSGDVFIEAGYYGGSTIFEYAHGGTTPIASLDVGSYIYTDDCASDPSTGNLAATSYAMRSVDGNVAIFAGATGSPTYYTDPNMYVYSSCTYDDSGNLFIEGTLNSDGIQLAELPSGKSTFVNITLNKTLQSTGALQWHDGNLLVQDGNTLYRVSIAGSSGTVVGTTILRRKGGGLVNIFDDRIIAPDYSKTAPKDVGVWALPKGAKPRAKFEAGDVKHPYSAVVSVGTLHRQSRMRP